MKRSIVLSFAWAALGLAIGSAQAGNLGVANGFTEFVFTDSTRTGVDSEGQVAVGGNATFNNFTVASNITGGNIQGTNSLIVGGNLGGSQAVVQGYGNALYGTKTANLYFNGGGTGSPGSSTGFFSGAETYLKSLSTTLQNSVANGTTSVNGSGYVTLTGSSGTLDVFNLTGAQLAGALNQGLTINAPSSATVVVNIDGTSDMFKGFSTTLNGVLQTNVLYNFTQASSLTIDNTSILGSILAPLATVHFNGGNINGTLIANALTSDLSYTSGESHLDLFTGNLPAPSAVPEPGSLALLATAGAFAIVPIARRRFRRQV